MRWRNAIGPDDAAYFALALKLGYPIWSNDRWLKSQTRVKVLNTSELLRARNRGLGL